MKKQPEVLTDIRKKHKISRKGLEALSGFKERTIASYERGERIPSKEYLQFLSLYFNITLNSIIECNPDRFMTQVELTLERFKYIYDLKDNDIYAAIGLKEEEYIKLKGSSRINENMIDSLLDIFYKFKIKPSSFGFNINERIRHKRLYTFDLSESATHLFHEYEYNEKFTFISDEFYLSVVRKRNDPSNKFIPNENKLNIKEEYKEILSLLDYAPETFRSNLILKLKEYKKSQEIFFN